MAETRVDVELVLDTCRGELSIERRHIVHSHARVLVAPETEDRTFHLRGEVDRPRRCARVGGETVVADRGSDIRAPRSKQQAARRSSRPCRTRSCPPRPWCRRDREASRWQRTCRRRSARSRGVSRAPSRRRGSAPVADLRGRRIRASPQRIPPARDGARCARRTESARRRRSSPAPPALACARGARRIRASRRRER
jgi:hypothetical protein